jgi:sulfur-oxidizing protein SoxY
MNLARRELLKRGGNLSLLAVALGAGLLKPGFAFAADWNQPAFSATDLAGAIKGLGGSDPSPSTEIAFTAPDIAENGAVVPVTVTSKIPNTQSISVFVEKNPNPLTAVFDIAEGTEPSITTRVKMGQTSNVHALVKADGKFYVTTKEVKVTLGGCGG